MRIRKKTIGYFVLFVITLLIGFMTSKVLPEKYFFDANLITQDPYNQKGLMGSYSFCMWLYDITGLNRLDYSIVALIQLPIIFLVLWSIGVPDRFNRIYLSNAVIWVTLLLCSVYIAMPSKEFVNFLYIALLVKVLLGRSAFWPKIVVVFLLLFWFGVWYRPYYLLVPFFAAVLYFGSFIKLKNTGINNVIFGLFFACLLSLSFGVVKGEYLTEGTRERLNKDRKGREDSQTIILSPVKTDNVIGESVSIFYGFVSVNFPVNGFRFYNKPQVIAFILWQLVLLSYLFFQYNRCMKKQEAVQA
ncbi:hypothetical protein BST99_11340 [Aureicoccus marinus]|uniref:Glycosyltransferase RgtA/B/C/D-like domain-containing protein n=2 Tax=Aureicoccus marinus TaxID=754435 RepID=A0A2S7T9T9_9FLAO|nr:hypothetical protein BST99_11340 [Aureicoccus marinus]